MLLIYLHPWFVLHSSQQAGAAEVQADPRSYESSSLQCRTGAGSWEWWLCWLSSQPCLAMGSCSGLSSLEASPTPHSSRGLLRAAVSCHQHWASSLPAASAPSTGFLTTSAAQVANFGRGQGRKLEGALMLGPCWWGSYFSKAVKNLIQEFYSSISSLVQAVHSNAVALQPYNLAVFSRKTDWGYLKKNLRS